MKVDALEFWPARLQHLQHEIKAEQPHAEDATLSNAFVTFRSVWLQSLWTISTSHLFCLHCCESFGAHIHSRQGAMLMPIPQPAGSPLFSPAASLLIPCAALPPSVALWCPFTVLRDSIARLHVAAVRCLAARDRLLQVETAPQSPYFGLEGLCC